MTKTQQSAYDTQLSQIIAGKTYPMSVHITEMFKGKKMTTTFNLNSFFCGMYCTMYCNGALGAQTGDHDNKTFVTKLLHDITGAAKRGATIVIGSVFPVKREMT